VKGLNEPIKLIDETMHRPKVIHPKRQTDTTKKPDTLRRLENGLGLSAEEGRGKPRKSPG
jgi:hypothetical protein